MLGKCEVCNDQEAKYTCPRCEVKTCCITCVNIHKKELGCNGQRNKIAYKRISEFTNLDLLSDYRLLEETTRHVETYARDPSKHYTASKDLPINLYKLRAAAHRRRTNLQFLPHNFTRSKANSTYFNWKEQLIYWRVEWIFPHADNIKCVGRRLLESEPLSKLVNIYLDPKECDPLYQDKLQYYQSAGLRGLLLLLKAEQKPGTWFYQLDSSLSLKANLKEKTVIEFPTIYVVLKDHKDAFAILESDEEDKDRNEATINMNNKNNLLFNTSDYSESEDEYNTSVGSKKKYPKLDIPQYDVLIGLKS
ncbi:box C/D snoRNA protein 1 isoform X3 [Zootermopsis nevadensis]|uniref:box C/D snoRNA protein 1 isoform X2 n=1 Tax=Zootermopsis nevadensis TaxID=136037 RepID=UPI000B8E4E2D|nr:box C/D snoRNA protein 1 isoform X2 [Zootermopsis nevadensis]XP_021922713.1 box C/D snoRNA protein 1 isoform X3 [Zootermopsis nevadensis]